MKEIIETNGKRVRIYAIIENQEIQRQLIRVASGIPVFRLVGVSDNGEDAMLDIIKVKPDIVITELYLSGMDASVMMQLLSEMMGEWMPCFIVCYEWMPTAFRAVMEQNRVVSCIMFPVKDHILSRQLQNILACYEHMQQERQQEKRGQLEKKLLRETSQYDQKGRKQERIAEIVDCELELVGMPQHLKGCRYVKQALIWLLLNPEKQVRMQELYQQLANVYEVKSSSVERCMRTVIKKTWQSGRGEYLKTLFEYQELGAFNRPSNSRFLRFLVNTMRKEYIW